MADLENNKNEQNVNSKVSNKDTKQVDSKANEQVDNSTAEEPEEKLYTETELQNIIKSRVSREKKSAEEKIKEAQKLAQMDEAEKQAYELENLRKQVAEYEKKAERADLAREASKILRGKGINADERVLDFVVREDAESTREAIDGFTELVNSIVDVKVKQKLSGKAPKFVSDNKHSLTKEEILKEKDSVKRKRLIAENIDLFS